MSSAVFPTLGSQFRRTRSPEFSSNIFTAVSGKEYRTSRRGNPASTFVLSFDRLPFGTDLDTLYGFFISRRGDFDSFLIVDADDNTATAQAIGTGDGATKTFQLVRTLGGVTETIQAPNVVAHVYDNGVDGGGWSVSSWGSATPGVVTYAVAPVAGHAITADLTFYWPVRFADPLVDFERFMNRLYEVKQLKVKQLL